MPNYPWLLTQKLDTNAVVPRISALRKAGVPYAPGYEKAAVNDLVKQAGEVVKNLKQGQIEAQPDREIIALIAYLQRLGTDIKGATPPAAPPVAPETAPVKATEAPAPGKSAQLDTAETRN